MNRGRGDPIPRAALSLSFRITTLRRRIVKTVMGTMGIERCHAVSGLMNALRHSQDALGLLLAGRMAKQLRVEERDGVKVLLGGILDLVVLTSQDACAAEEILARLLETPHEERTCLNCEGIGYLYRALGSVRVKCHHCHGCGRVKHETKGRANAAARAWHDG